MKQITRVKCICKCNIKSEKAKTFKTPWKSREIASLYYRCMVKC